MKAARLSRSERLQRVLAVLAEGRPVTTRTIVRRARVCAVNAIVAELRANGAAIACWQEVERGRRRWFYRLIAAPRPIQEDGRG